MAHIIESIEAVESIFHPHGLTVELRKLISAGFREVPVAHKPGSKIYYFLVQRDNWVEVIGRCPLRNCTLHAKGTSYLKARAELRLKVAEYNATVTKRYLEI